MPKQDGAAAMATPTEAGDRARGRSAHQTEPVQDLFQQVSLFT